MVDAAFFAQGLLRAPEQLWERLDNETKLNVINALKQTGCYLLFAVTGFYFYARGYTIILTK